MNNNDISFKKVDMYSTPSLQKQAKIKNFKTSFNKIRKTSKDMNLIITTNNIEKLVIKNETPNKLKVDNPTQKKKKLTKVNSMPDIINYNKIPDR
jgi:hypothetical protein